MFREIKDAEIQKNQGKCQSIKMNFVLIKHYFKLNYSEYSKLQNLNNAVM
jgi:hypothetical protein